MEMTQQCYGAEFNVTAAGKHCSMTLHQSCLIQCCHLLVNLLAAVQAARCTLQDVNSCLKVPRKEETIHFHLLDTIETWPRLVRHRKELYNQILKIRLNWFVISGEIKWLKDQQD